jgi:DNA ligase-1
MLLGSLPRVAELALTKGPQAINEAKVTLFVPIKPMLAEMAENIDQVIRDHGGTSAFEYKYDGARIQIHRKNGEVRIFTRRLTDVTDSTPDIIQLAKQRIRSQDYLLEGEARYRFRI